LSRVRQAFRILFVTLGSGREACTRVRVLQYLPYFAARGVAADVLPFFPDVGDGGPTGKPSLVRRLADAQYPWRRALRVARVAPDYDLVFLQRVLLPEPMLRLLRRRARKLVFDFDDAIYTTHAGAQPVPADLADRFARTVGASDAVIAATPHLCDRARAHRPRVHCIPSAVDCDRYRPRDRSGPAPRSVTIGWIGSSSTTMYLNPVLPLLRRLAAADPAVRIELVGARLPPDAAIHVHPWSLEDERERLARFDIGIMPLDDDRWAAGKGGYKLLQYMACGIPSVASPIGANTNIVGEGRTGFLAATAGEWDSCLRRLVADRALRERMGQQARVEVESEHSLARWAPRLLELLTQCAAA